MPPRRIDDQFLTTNPWRRRRNLLSVSSSGNGDLYPSLLVIILILTGVFLASVMISLLLRYITRLCKSAHIEPDQEEEEDVMEEAPLSLNQIVSGGNGNGNNRLPPRVMISSSQEQDQDQQNQKLIESLPLFSFESVTGLKSSASADCAVCLSKFERHDQLRLLPICCHAFHSDCIDMWLSSNTTCPLCRSTVNVAKSEDYLKLFADDLPSSRSSSARNGSSAGNNDSFRIEIGSVSRRRISPLEEEDEAGGGDPRLRSYSMGSFEYVVDDESEVVVESTHHRRGVSECSFGAKNELSAPETEMTTTNPNPQPPGSEIAGEVGEAGRGWLRDYVDKLAYSSSSSLSRSFRFSGRFFTGSNRMSEGGLSRSGRRSSVDIAGGDSRGGSWDLEGNRYGEEISNFFRWLSGV